MKKLYIPKLENRDIIRQLVALPVKVTAKNYKIISIECDASKLNAVKQITGLDFEEKEEI